MQTVIKEFAPKSSGGLLPTLKYQRWRFPLRKKYLPFFENKHGIEVGGPSGLFRTMLPLYDVVAGLDGANFANETVWEGRISAGQNFEYTTNKRGHQYISEATDLSEIPTGHYDFLLSSNCLEHVANPLKALTEWRRVIKPGGGFVLALPNKKSNFDHQRPETPFEHLLEDFTGDVGEDDLTHIEEILSLHDLKLDPPAGDLANFRERSLKNFENRTLHHHIFDPPLMEKMLRHVGFSVVDLTTIRTDFIALARKDSDDSEPR